MRRPQQLRSSLRQAQAAEPGRGPWRDPQRSASPRRSGRARSEPDCVLGERGAARQYLLTTVQGQRPNRKSVVKGKRGHVSVKLGGCRIVKKKKREEIKT